MMEPSPPGEDQKEHNGFQGHQAQCGPQAGQARGHPGVQTLTDYTIKFSNVLKIHDKG